MHPRHTESAGNMFMVIATGMLVISIVLGIGVFAYSHFLKSESASKAEELQAAQAGVSEETVEGFIRLRNRLTSSQTILNDHVMLSQFFDSLEEITLEGVRFSSLTVDVLEDRTAEIELTGTARNFNALAGQSAAFAAEKRIRQAIFSDITANDRGAVTFSVTAVLHPAFVRLPAGVPASWAPAAPAAETPVATTTAATTTTP